MIFSAEIELDVARARERFEWFLRNKKRFELKEKKNKRSISQNSYLHLILTWFGVEFGYTLSEVKQEIFKKEVNSDIFYNGAKEGIVTIEQWRSTADLDTGELTLAIDRFRDFSSKHGCYLPEPTDLIMIQQLENELSKHSNKLFI